MKRKPLVAALIGACVLLVTSATALAGVAPPPNPPVCAYCGVRLDAGAPHKKGCPYATKNQLDGTRDDVVCMNHDHQHEAQKTPSALR